MPGTVLLRFKSAPTLHRFPKSGSLGDTLLESTIPALSPAIARRVTKYLGCTYMHPR